MTKLEKPKWDDKWLSDHYESFRLSNEALDKSIKEELGERGYADIMQKINEEYPVKKSIIDDLIFLGIGVAKVTDGKIENGLDDYLNGTDK